MNPYFYDNPTSKNIKLKNKYVNSLFKTQHYDISRL